MRVDVLGLGLLALLGGLVACSNPDGDAEAATSQEAPLVNQVSTDTTVLKAQVSESINGYGSPGFTPSDCVASANGERMNCTHALEDRFDAPSLHDVDLYTNTSQFYCRVLHVVTVSKRSAVQASSGIGFFYRGYTGNGRFIAKNKLKKVGEATLKDGSPADLHEFVALANCWLGSASSSMQARYEFKPYIAFDAANGESYHNWDTASGNHSVTTNHFTWDRSSDLLR